MMMIITFAQHRTYSFRGNVEGLSQVVGKQVYKKKLFKCLFKPLDSQLFTRTSISKGSQMTGTTYETEHLVKSVD